MVDPAGLGVWLQWARGPLFWGCLTFLVLGLLRHLVLTTWEAVRATRPTREGAVPYREAMTAALRCLSPIGTIRGRFLLRLTGAIFTVSVIIVPVFLGGHIVLWGRGAGISWPSLPDLLADALTITAVAAMALLLLQRAASREVRGPGRARDYLIPLAVALPFVSGFLVRHPNLSPLSYEIALFLHVMSANLVLVLVPLTTLGRRLRIPRGRRISRTRERPPAEAERVVAMALGEEKEPT
jgi:hypothetical protein